MIDLTDNRRAVVVHARRDRNAELLGLFAGMNAAMDRLLAAYGDDQLKLLADFLRRTTDAGRNATDHLADPARDFGPNKQANRIEDAGAACRDAVKPAAQAGALLLRDRDAKFTRSFDEVFRSEGAEVLPTRVQAPNAKADAERWSGRRIRRLACTSPASASQVRCAGATASAGCSTSTTDELHERISAPHAQRNTRVPPVGNMAEPGSR